MIPRNDVEAVRRIHRWFERLEQTDGRMAREDACFLMVQARHLVEASSDRNAFNVVKFYADWTVHTELDRSPFCLDMLRDLTTVLAENFAPTDRDVTRQVSNVIGFRVLRAQLVALFRTYDLPAVVFEYYANWKDFVGFLLWLLKGQTISFPAKRTRSATSVYNQALKSGAAVGIVVEGLEIAEVGGKPHWLLHVGGNKPVRMLGRILLDEDPGSFRVLT